MKTQLIYVVVRGAVQGPYPYAEARALVDQGQLDSSALFWFRGLDQWITADELRPPAVGLFLDPSQVLVTTTNDVPNRGLEFVHGVLGADASSAGVDVGASAKALEALRSQCVDRLRQTAANLNCDVLLGVAFQAVTWPTTGAVSLSVTATAARLGFPRLPMR